VALERSAFSEREPAGWWRWRRRDIAESALGAAMSCGAGSRWSWRGRSRGGYRRLRMPARTGFAQPRYPAVWPWAILATALRGLDRPLSFHIFGRGLRSHANSEAFTSERSFIAALKSLRHPEADSSG